MIMKKLFVLGVIVATLLVASVVSAKTMRDRWQTGVVGEPPWVRDSAVFVPAREQNLPGIEAELELKTRDLESSRSTYLQPRLYGYKNRAAYFGDRIQKFFDDNGIEGKAFAHTGSRWHGHVQLTPKGAMQYMEYMQNQR